MKNFIHFINEQNDSKTSVKELKHGATVSRSHPGLKHMKYKVIKDDEHMHRWMLEDENGKVVISVSSETHEGAIEAIRSEGYDV